MESSPPYPIGPGQRVLAAIVFTDVVSFSARMQTEEIATLSRLEQDFALMRKTCEKYSGTVLKTTGDGLLLYFTSAVQAVTCAQKMQRDFAQRAKDEPAEALKHRIGIHLGEVFVTDQDVMGDGVNIAARIQAQAEPGGIVISQMVYDVVKNKLKLDVAKLGARELKNISEAVPMYQLLLEPPKPAPARSPVKLRPAPVKAPAFSLTGMQKLAVAGGSILALGLAAWLFTQAREKHDANLAKYEAERSALDAALRAKNAASSDQTAPGGAGQPAGYDFAALARRAAGSPDEPAARQKAAEEMRPLQAWMNGALERYTKDSPLLVHELGGATADEMTIFTDGHGGLYFSKSGAIRRRSWSDLKPGEFGAIVVSVLLNAPVPPPREIIRGAEAYAYFHRLPAMIDALQQANLRGMPR